MKKHPQNRFGRGSSQCGFTLLEVLVALIVLSIGLLGLSGLQTLGLRNNHSAFVRSQATLVTSDIVDRMRANRQAALDGRYNFDYDTDPPIVSCTDRCTALTIARMDVRTWRTYVERLPAGESEIDVDAGGVATIRVQWADSRDASDKLEIVTMVQL